MPSQLMMSASAMATTMIERQHLVPFALLSVHSFALLSVRFFALLSVRVYSSLPRHHIDAMAQLAGGPFGGTLEKGPFEGEKPRFLDL